MKVRILKKKDRFYPQQYVDIEDNPIFSTHYQWQYYYVTKTYKDLFSKTERSFGTQEEASSFLREQEMKVVEEFEI